MTVATTGSGGFAIPGMEDMDASDLRVPRLKIVHAEGLFKDPGSNRTWPKMKAVILGVVKQRVMWDKVVEEGDVPRCRSVNHSIGYPNTDDDAPGRLRYPWKEQSAFDPATAQTDSQGRVILPCASCEFTKWNDKTPPRCSEQYAMPLIYSTEDEPDVWLTAILTVQKTGIRPTSNYMSDFLRRKEPMFTRYTEISLNTARQGTVDYSVPRYQGLEPTPIEDREDYADQLTAIREFLRQEPRTGNELGEASDNTNTPAPGAPAAAPAPAPAPAPSAPASAPAPAPAASAPAPAPEPAPAPAPPAPAAPAASAPVAASSDDDLPF